MTRWISLAIVVLTAGAALAESSPGVAGLPEPPAEALLADIPFEPDTPTNRVMIDLAPEGRRPLVMLLDTGATWTSITPRTARELGVSVRRTKSSPYRRKTRLGDDMQFWIADELSDTGSRTGWEYGLLGANFLREYVLELDFDRRRVRFFDPKKYRLPKSVDAPNEAIVPVRLVSGRLFPEIEMNGRKVRVCLDTGAPPPLILSGRAAKKLGVDAKSLLPVGSLGTVKGPMAIHLHETESLRLGPFAFDATPVLVAPRGWYNQAGATDSVIGYDVLRHFTIRIDYERKRMWLRRESTEVTFMGSEYGSTRVAGAFFWPAGKSYQVMGVLPDSPADRFGLRPGDVLVGLGGERMRPLPEILARIQNGEEIFVARQTKDGVWLDMALPVDAAVESSSVVFDED